MKYDFADFAYDVYETDPWWPRSRLVRKVFLVIGICVLVPIVIFQDPLAAAIYGPIGPFLLAVAKVAKELATSDDGE
jgi:hypothetical protein